MKKKKFFEPVKKPPKKKNTSSPQKWTATKKRKKMKPEKMRQYTKLTYRQASFPQFFQIPHPPINNHALRTQNFHPHSHDPAEHRICLPSRLAHHHDGVGGREIDVVRVRWDVAA